MADRMRLSEQTVRTERAALAVWNAQFGYEPREPLREKGGALDRNAWCWEVAWAVGHRYPPPRLASDRDVPRHVIQAAKEAFEV